MFALDILTPPPPRVQARPVADLRRELRGQMEWGICASLDKAVRPVPVSPPALPPTQLVLGPDSCRIQHLVVFLLHRTIGGLH